MRQLQFSYSVKMELRVAVIKTFLILFLTPLSSTALQSLQHSTAVTARVNFTAVFVNGDQILYYSPSNNRTMAAEYLQEDDRQYHWDRFRGEQIDLYHHFIHVVKVFNHTAGDHTMQWKYGCELHDNGTTRLYNMFSYDGADFLHLNLSSLNWIAANEKAEIFKNEWDTTGEEAKHMKHYLEEKCIDVLKESLSRLNTSLRKSKVRPEASLFQSHSSSPEVVCHATGFFPKSVIITWQKDREDVTENVELSETLPNQDGTFQKRSVLKVSAEELQKHKYTCVIQHSSLEEDLVLLVSERRILRVEGPNGGSGRGRAGLWISGGCFFVLVLVCLWKYYKRQFHEV